MCLNSIFKQNIPQDDYEIIIVNDCSVDNTSEVIRQFQKEYSNIVLLEHKQNKKAGGARNSGIEVAKGSYLSFIDVDDYLSSSSIIPLIEEAYVNNLDMLAFSFLVQTKNGNFVEKGITNIQKTRILSGKEFISEYFNSTYSLSPCFYIYKRDFWQANNFKFVENVFWEDADLIAQCLFKADRIKYISTPMYCWVYNIQSTSRTLSGKKLGDMVKMSNRNYLFSKKIIDEDIEFSKKMYSAAMWNATCIKKIIFMSYNERKIFYNELTEDIYKGVIREIKDWKLKFLYKYPTIVNIFLYPIAPLLAILKSTKNKL